MFKKFNKNNDGSKDKDKKNIYIVLGIAVVCIISIAMIPSDSKSDTKESQANKDSKIISEEEKNQENSSSLESKLKSILSQIEGAGDVDVMITYQASEEIEPAFNTNSTTEKTEEKDTKGGERTITTSSENKTMITSSSSEPIVIKTTEPQIQGVLVVASGASDPKVKETLYSAVQTALQIQGHQVEVHSK